MMMRNARRLSTQAIDWTATMAKLSTADKAKLAATRSSIENMKSIIASAKQEVKTIDWAFYEKSIKTPGFVAEVRKSLEGAKVPEVVPFAGRSAADEKSLKAAEALAQRATAEIKELEKSLATLKANGTTRETTINDVARVYPEMLKEVDKEIEAGQYIKPSQ